MNLDISIFGFALNNSSKKFGVRLEMEMGGSISPLSVNPLLVLVRHSEMLLLLGNCVCLRHSPSGLLKKAHMPIALSMVEGCAQSPHYNVLAKYASARRFFARLASEIFLSSLQQSFSATC
ncbi:MAG: hypothetical protein Q8S00_15345 [Deltaproteobacteria bacterium]|nr:hypothetical protein [Deltaproteobacteria bacterium]